MTDRSALWQELVSTYFKTRISCPSLRLITLAQWAHESKWGTSDLARLHNNFGGLNYRPRMRWRAKPVAYESSDGLNTYCEFRNPKAFIRGYWHFIKNRRYDGWRNYKHDPEGYIAFIVSRGYATDPDYPTKVMAVHAQVLAERAPGQRAIRE